MGLGDHQPRNSQRASGSEEAQGNRAIGRPKRYVDRSSERALVHFAAAEMAVGLGARRGEVLARRWSDIVDGRAFISRSLSQTKGALQFIGTKTDEVLGLKILERPCQSSMHTASGRTSSALNSARTTRATST